MSRGEYILKQQQKLESKERERQKRSMTRALKTAAVILTAGAVIFLGGWYLVQNYQPVSGSEIVSKQGMHWHPQLSIKILGEYQEIPPSIGLGVKENPIHTHEEDGIIHLEFSGLVREDDLRLGRFFEVWGKTFNKDCVFDKCSGQAGQLKMLVNGQENQEFENYVMRDQDRIEIIFE